MNKLLEPSSYPHETEKEIELIETNISWILLTGPYAYKMKKKIKFGEVLDFSTLKKRLEACKNEITLNRRLAPDIYLSVEGINEKGFLSDKGESIEYLVKMKQLPQESLLSYKVKNEKNLRDITIKNIAKRIAEFHQQNIIYPKFSHYESIVEKWDENFRTTKTYSNFPYDVKLEKRVNDYLKRNKAFWERRKDLGKIVDGHGDLILSNIFEHNDNIVIFDCIEFNEMLRIQDVLEELAFLSMDLDFNGLTKQSELFLLTYLEETNDKMLPSSPFIQFYKSYRAYVRAKVYCSLSLQDISLDEKDQLLSLTEKYRELASTYIF
ncbi:MAG: hypothetical protein ACFFDS_09585 [Candidatus Thorarchaeota archaeon]